MNPDSWKRCRHALMISRGFAYLDRHRSTANRKGLRRGSLPLVVVMAGLVSSGAAAAAMAGSKYQPAPVASKGGALRKCPNPNGLVKFTAVAQRGAVRDALTYGRKSLRTDLSYSDRAWWPDVKTLWRTPSMRKGLNGEHSYGTRAGRQMPYATVVRASCGSGLVAKSLTVSVGPDPKHASGCNACISSIFFVDRFGRPLIYWIN